MTLAVPTVHMNGTSRDELLDQICTALSALRDAQAAMAKAGPNGRDYYPQGPEALRQAQRQHRARMESVQAIHDELESIGEAIAFR